MKLTLKTGYGYILNPDGSFNTKFDLPKGEHEFPEGYQVVELTSKEELHSNPICNPSPTDKQIDEITESSYQPQFDRLALEFLKASIRDDKNKMDKIKTEFIKLEDEKNSKLKVKE
jgi:hypothetical protein